MKAILLKQKSMPKTEKISKKEIEKTLDMINQAFVTLLNNLFRDAAFDASADAQVLQTMLAKEGLTESDFVREKSV